MSSPERHARLFRNGRNQALRIPREFELEGNEALSSTRKGIDSSWSRSVKAGCWLCWPPWIY